MKKPIHIAIIPASQGTYEVYFDDTVGLCLGDPVIAFRIETFEVQRGHLCRDAGETYSECIALTFHGDAASNGFGVQHADGTVVIYQDATYKTFSEAQAAYLPPEE